jgi:hypothetical protein
VKYFLTGIFFWLFTPWVYGQNPQNAPSENPENRIIDTIAHLPEVKQRSAQLENSTDGKRHLQIAIYQKPNKSRKYYLVKVLEDNGSTFVTEFNFYVYPQTMAIKYLDTMTGKMLDLRTWRKRQNN